MARSSHMLHRPEMAASFPPTIAMKIASVTKGSTRKRTKIEKKTKTSELLSGTKRRNIRSIRRKKMTKTPTMM
jgi:hypothetical protein